MALLTTFSSPSIPKFPPFDNLIRSPSTGRILDQFFKYNNASQPLASPRLPNTTPTVKCGRHSAYQQNLLFFLDYVIILDLDETLLHTEWIRGNPECYVVHERPFVREFLRALKKLLVEVVIFTAGVQCYADTVIDIMDETTQTIGHRLYRQHTTGCGTQRWKDLSLLNRDLLRTLIIDNSPEVFQRHPDNGLVISPWEGHPFIKISNGERKFMQVEEYALINLFFWLEYLCNQNLSIPEFVRQYRNDIRVAVGKNIAFAAPKNYCPPFPLGPVSKELLQRCHPERLLALPKTLPLSWAHLQKDDNPKLSSFKFDSLGSINNGTSALKTDNSEQQHLSNTRHQSIQPLGALPDQTTFLREANKPTVSSTTFDCTLLDGLTPSKVPLPSTQSCTISSLANDHNATEKTLNLFKRNNDRLQVNLNDMTQPLLSAQKRDSLIPRCLLPLNSNAFLKGKCISTPRECLRSSSSQNKVRNPKPTSIPWLQRFQPKFVKNENQAPPSSSSSLLDGILKTEASLKDFSSKCRCSSTPIKVEKNNNTTDTTVPCRSSSNTWLKGTPSTLSLNVDSTNTTTTRQKRDQNISTLLRMFIGSQEATTKKNYSLRIPQIASYT